MNKHDAGTIRSKNGVPGDFIVELEVVSHFGFSRRSSQGLLEL